LGCRKWDVSQEKSKLGVNQSPQTRPMPPPAPTCWSFDQSGVCPVTSTCGVSGMTGFAPNREPKLFVITLLFARTDFN